MDGAVAHGEEEVVFLELDLGFVDHLPLDLRAGFGDFHKLAVPDEDEEGVVVLDDLRLFVFDDVNDGEGGIGHAPHSADRQCGGNGGDAVFQAHIGRHHRGDDLGGQGRENIRLDAAAHSVSQNNDGGVFALVHDFHAVTAELLPPLVQAQVSDVGTEVIHRPWSPSI